MRLRQCDQCGTVGRREGRLWIEIRFLSAVHEPRHFDVCSPNCGRGLMDELEELRSLEIAVKTQLEGDA